MATTPFLGTGSTYPPIRNPFFQQEPLKAFNKTWVNWFQLLEALRTSTPQFASGTNAQRGSTNAAIYPDGTIYYESDRKVFYIIIGKVFRYLAGEFQCQQFQIPTNLGVNDAGFIANVTDYQHVLLWDGSQFNWGPGDSGSGYVVSFPVGDPVPGTGWQACDGSVNVGLLQSDGNLNFVTAPLLANSFLRQ